MSLIDDLLQRFSQNPVTIAYKETLGIPSAPATTSLKCFKRISKLALRSLVPFDVLTLDQWVGELVELSTVFPGELNLQSCFKPLELIEEEWTSPLIKKYGDLPSTLEEFNQPQWNTSILFRGLKKGRHLLIAPVLVGTNVPDDTPLDLSFADLVQASTPVACLRPIGGQSMPTAPNLRNYPIPERRNPEAAPPTPQRPRDPQPPTAVHKGLYTVYKDLPYLVLDVENGKCLALPCGPIRTLPVVDCKDPIKNIPQLHPPKPSTVRIELPRAKISDLHPGECFMYKEHVFMIATDPELGDLKNEWVFVNLESGSTSFTIPAFQRPMLTVPFFNLSHTV